MEFLGIVAPIVCLIDCIVLPIMAAVLPFLSMGQILHGVSDQMIAMVVFAICLTAIVPGFLKHRSKRVLFLFASGVSLMFFVSFAGKNLDHIVHALMTVAVSYLLIRANLENKKLSKCACDHHHHPVKERTLVASAHEH